MPAQCCPEKPIQTVMRWISDFTKLLTCIYATLIILNYPGQHQTKLFINHSKIPNIVWHTTMESNELTMEKVHSATRK